MKAVFVLLMGLAFAYGSSFSRNKNEEGIDQHIDEKNGARWMGHKSAEDDVPMALGAIEPSPEVLKKYIRRKLAPVRCQESGDSSNGAENVKDIRQKKSMPSKLKFI
ncbi:unnamed protein product [Calicophoron daubneyi]|uniref:Uncharacterized protein n=1 Tax=Calicophoron daubneyi TaxID=300641 RepID=A0AAV2TVX2_CALDB